MRASDLALDGLLVFHRDGGILRFAGQRALVLGNTDSTGTAEINARIAQRRAQLVAAVLRQYSRAETPIELKSTSSDAPLATNTTPEGRDANRRVDVFLLPQ